MRVKQKLIATMDNNHQYGNTTKLLRIILEGKLTLLPNFDNLKARFYKTIFLFRHLRNILEI